MSSDTLQSPRSDADEPLVIILMATFNGARGLHDQLASIAAQQHRNWRLIVSDDASHDNSREIVREFAKGFPPDTVILSSGPKKGASENFMSLIRTAAKTQTQIVAHDSTTPCPYLAFCDQDDIWLPDRLSRGVATLSNSSPETPTLYCSRTWITDSQAIQRRLSRPRPRPPSFRNALVQNIAAGNTILLNPTATELVFAAANDVVCVVVHDWWTYQLITGAAGTVIHDDNPTVVYRQHADNVIGANDTIKARIHRIRQMLRGDFHEWNTINIAALKASSHRLSPRHRYELNRFDLLRRTPLLRRLGGLRKLRLYRQSRISTLALWITALIGRL